MQVKDVEPHRVSVPRLVLFAPQYDCCCCFEISTPSNSPHVAKAVFVCVRPGQTCDYFRTKDGAQARQGNAK